MARRKRPMLDDSDSDDSPTSDADDAGFDETDPDARAERQLFEGPYQRKRRRTNGKEDAIYGVFGDDSDEEGYRGKGKEKAKRSDWAKAPAFVSGETVNPQKVSDMDASPRATADDEHADMKDEDEDEDEDGDGDGEEDEEDSSEDEVSKPASPRIREGEDELDEVPRSGGLGLGASKFGVASAFSSSSRGIGSSGADSLPGSRRGGIGSSSKTSAPAFSAPKRGGIGSSNEAPSSGLSGFSRGGIGSSSEPSEPPRQPTPPSAFNGDLPSSFGGKPRAQRAFVRAESPSTRSATPLSSTEAAHFSKLQGTFGARMLAKMGWQTGTSLGVSGDGIVTPIESKLRPKGAGLAFKGFKEKTEQSKAEARRRGEAVSDDEEEKIKKRREKAKTKEGAPRSDAWKKPKKVKTKVEHKTYEQIVAEAGAEPVNSGLGQIIDATGATPREVSSLADVSISSWTPSNDPTRIPEVRHNLRLIVDTSKGDLDGLAREAKALEERKKFIANEEARLSKKVQQEAELIARLQQVHIVADEISARAREVSSMYEASLDSFAPEFEKLLGQYSREYDRWKLDEVVVAAMAPVLRRMLAQWVPLESPTAFASTFRKWRSLLKTNTVDEAPQTQVDVYGARTVSSAPPAIEKPMTPYESLLWNAWLPKVRSCVNNDWAPSDPQPLVALYEAWAALLPPFVRDNFFDQLVLPKVHKAVAEWTPRRAPAPLRTLVFPWLPHIGLRVEALLDDARRKVKSVSRAAVISDGVPNDLGEWREVFDKGEWDTMMLKYIVPKLGATLRDDFRVNPRAQDLTPLQHVLAWAPFVRASIFGPLLEREFFPKWLAVLHLWLVQPRPSYDEIAEWYDKWKQVFPQPVLDIGAVQHGFTRGLQLMNKAIELGPDAPTKLPKPDDVRAPPPAGAAPAPKERPRAARTQEITFRAIVEEYAAGHNLLFVPTGRAHPASRMPLFRVSPRADGRGGLLVYVQDDAVWAPPPGVGAGADVDAEVFHAIGLEEMALRANRA